MNKCVHKHASLLPDWFQGVCHPACGPEKRRKNSVVAGVRFAVLRMKNVFYVNSNPKPTLLKGIEFTFTILLEHRNLFFNDKILH